MDEAKLKEINDALPPAAAKILPDVADIEEFPFEFTFHPKEPFEWAQEGRLIGAYYPGNGYNCTRFPVHAALRKMCRKWFDEGKIQIVPLAAYQRFVMTGPGAPPQQ